MVVVVVVVVVDVLVVVDVARDEIVAAVVGVVAVFEVLGPDVAPVEHAARSAAIVPTVTGNRRKEGRGREREDTGEDSLVTETGNPLKVRCGAAVKRVAGQPNTCSLH